MMISLTLFAITTVVFRRPFSICITGVYAEARRFRAIPVNPVFAGIFAPASASRACDLFGELRPNSARRKTRPLDTQWGHVRAR